MASTPMDLDREQASNSTPLNITRTAGSNVPSTTPVSDIISTFRPTKLFKRQDIKPDRPTPHVLSLHFDDPGELLMTSESDETIQLYNVKEGRHDKSLLSKKYGVKLAKFTHTSSSIIYASTKTNDAIRYLATHDNSFIRYFEGHEAPVTCLAMHPGTDNFISCGKDNTVRLWNVGTKHFVGQLNLSSPYLAAYDPSGNVFAVGSPAAGEILLYDCRNFDRAPFATFDVVDSCRGADTQFLARGWTALAFSNDGKHLLLGTRGGGHFLLDAFDGTMKACLRKPEGAGGAGRLAVGESPLTNGVTGRAPGPASVESSGECAFTPDGRYVLSGGRKDVLVWDLLAPVPESRILEPAYVLEERREAAVLAFNPRYNFFATADQEVVFWTPDPHA